uniref:Uncharacterized protein n=1 Tax=Romanomermis culicivorax TaxID=13658 RepID=A0A915J0E0_ROMCU
MMEKPPCLSISDLGRAQTCTYNFAFLFKLIRFHSGNYKPKTNSSPKHTLRPQPKPSVCKQCNLCVKA